MKRGKVLGIKKKLLAVTFSFFFSSSLLFLSSLLPPFLPPSLSSFSLHPSLSFEIEKFCLLFAPLQLYLCLWYIVCFLSHGSFWVL